MRALLHPTALPPARHIRLSCALGQGKKPATRSTYRHGDLQRALLDAGIALAQSGGPDAVVLREATRRAGVVPNAAYRHFASRLGLLRAVRMAALARLALSMQAELDALSSTLDSAELARASLRDRARLFALRSDRNRVVPYHLRGAQ